MIERGAITETELRAAFRRSGLWRRGWDYRKATGCESVLRGLIATARACRASIERQTGKPAPQQRALI